jgi:hypothetical protein
MQRLIKPVLVAVVLVLLAACSGDQNPPSPATPTAGVATDDPAYPGPQEPFEPAYPIEGFNEEIFEAGLTPNAPPPTFSDETGAMTIKLTYPDGERPVRGQLFFAAGTIPVQGVEDAFIPALDPDNDASGHSDSVGVLVISEILPGKYTLTLMTPLGPILVESVATGDAIVFEIVANQVLDLGDEAVFLDADTLEP